MRSFMVMVQRGRDQLAAILLTGWWGGTWESALSTFWFHLVGLFRLIQHLLGTYCVPGTMQGARTIEMEGHVVSPCPLHPHPARGHSVLGRCMGT